MMYFNHLFHNNGIRTRSLAIAIVCAVIMIGGCRSLTAKLDESKGDRAVEYKKSKSLPTLEVPPDLTSSTIDDALIVPDIDPSGTATFSDYSGERSDPQQLARREAVLPQTDNVRVERDGDKRWLVMQGDPAEVWPRVREFWIQNGFLIKTENPRIGIMETDWLENRADIPKDFIRSVLSKALDSAYSAPTRDKFRVRLEAGQEPDTTEVYLTHRGVEEVVQGESTIWQSRPSDPELEAEMLNRLVSSFGIDEQKTQAQLAKQDDDPRASLTRDATGVSSLSLEEDFSRAWRRTGLALDRVGFTVEDRDRSKGLYYVRYGDPDADDKEGGFFSRLKFWKGEDKALSNDEYLVNVVGAGEQTRVMVLNKAGAQENSATSERILSLLHEQLK